jgi:NADPH:quinone reductase-like Zn-dependent oxidoreductase
MTTMKAIRIHAYGGVENLHYDDVLRPETQAGQVLVSVYAAGVNPIDWKIREGYFKQMFDLPLVQGSVLGRGYAHAKRWALCQSSRLAALCC